MTHNHTLHGQRYRDPPPSGGSSASIQSGSDDDDKNYDYMQIDESLVDHPVETMGRFSTTDYLPYLHTLTHLLTHLLTLVLITSWLVL
jgi:hypothetical protein